jgi:hypothetical protein
VEINDIITSVLALIAILISCIALYFTWRFGRAQNKINLITINKHEADLLTAKQADIVYGLDSPSKNQKFRLINQGQSEARNIRLEFFDDNAFIMQSDLDEKLPIRELAPGDSVSFIAVISGSNAPTTEINIVWDDDNGVSNKKNVIIYLFC